jgi:hypothetical protein
LEEVRPNKNGTRKQIIQKDTDEILKKLNKKYKYWHYIMMSKD